MAWCNRLANGAGVEVINALIGNPFDPSIPFLIDLFSLSEDLVNLLLIGLDFHLNFIEDGSKVLMELSVKDLPQVEETKTLLHSSPADSY